MAVAAAGQRHRYMVLGPVEARLSGGLLPVARGHQALELAAPLAGPDRVVSVDTLLDALAVSGVH